MTEIHQLDVLVDQDVTQGGRLCVGDQERHIHRRVAQRIVGFTRRQFQEGRVVVVDAGVAQQLARQLIGPASSLADADPHPLELGQGVERRLRRQAETVKDPDRLEGNRRKRADNFGVALCRNATLNKGDVSLPFFEHLERRDRAGCWHDVRNKALLFGNFLVMLAVEEIGATLAAREKSEAVWRQRQKYLPNQPAQQEDACRNHRPLNALFNLGQHTHSPNALDSTSVASNCSRVRLHGAGAASPIRVKNGA